MKFPKEIVNLTEQLVNRCKSKKVKIATAESCTCGLIAACITSIPGSSEVFDRGFNTYSNKAKSEMLNIPIDIIIKEGAVSKKVAIAMCKGVIKKAPVQLSLGITGIAGPDGGTATKPVGTVHLAAMHIGKIPVHRKFSFLGNRDEVRIASVKASIEMLSSQL